MIQQILLSKFKKNLICMKIWWAFMIIQISKLMKLSKHYLILWIK